MRSDLLLIKTKLEEILSAEKGYFGRVYTWGQRPTEYEYVGYEMTEDISGVLQSMTPDQIKNLVTVMNYFEMHAQPARSMLDAKVEGYSYKFYSEIAWSHFMTMIMFGMLEVVVAKKQCAKLNKKGDLIYKGNEIKKFLEEYLSPEVKESIASRYRVEEMFKHKKPTNFSEVVDHLWRDIRCSFAHNAGLESKGLEWHALEGAGTKNDPITIKQDVPVQEWLQVTWQAILNSFGYKGSIDLSKYRDIIKQS